MDLKGDRYWTVARHRELTAIGKRYAVGDERYDEAVRRISAPGWTPTRARKPLPSLWEIASYWAQRDDWFAVPLTFPHCFGCDIADLWPETGDLKERWNTSGSWLQRGHLVNWARNGLDQIQNIVPLCKICNLEMPTFDAEHADDAVAWVQCGGAEEKVEQFIDACLARQAQLNS